MTSTSENRQTNGEPAAALDQTAGSRAGKVLAAVAWIGLAALSACSEVPSAGAVSPAVALGKNPPVPRIELDVGGPASAIGGPNPPIPEIGNQQQSAWNCADALSPHPGPRLALSTSDQDQMVMCLSAMQGTRNPPGSTEPLVPAGAQAAIFKLMASGSVASASVTAPNGQVWTASLVDRENFQFNDKTYPAAHYRFQSSGEKGDVWIETEPGIPYLVVTPRGTWRIGP